MNYELCPDGIYRTSSPVKHRNEEYEEGGFATLRAMQERHFWYRGRHRFLLSALDRCCQFGLRPRAAVDLGGGVGGWVRYLAERRGDQYATLALADSSDVALRMAANRLPKNVQRYQVDLMNLGWSAQWDVAFLLDVIEHLPDDAQAMLEVQEALRPGGFLFVTTPALPQFWSYNDELVHHLRRYSHSDFARLAERTGLQLCDSRYFMFFLSPLYWLTRRGKSIEAMTEEEKAALLEKTHRVPWSPLNRALAAVFAAEAPIGNRLRFPWGTSILGVFRRL